MWYKIMDYGVALPFYVENYLEDINPAHKKTPAQNYTPYDLFALKSKIEHDPLYVDYSKKHRCTIGFDYHYRNLLLYVHIGIVELGENDDEETSSPEWFKKLVYYYLNTHADYVVVYSDAYPIVNPDIPYWWLQYVLPYLDMDRMVRNVFYPEQLEDDTTKIAPYDHFYAHGKIYVKFIDFEDPNTFFNPDRADVTEIGDPAKLRKNHLPRGDYALYLERYTNLKDEIETAVKTLYKIGALPIKSEEQKLINDWSLKPLVSTNGIHQKSSLYFPNWNDERLTSYDGSFNLIKRQLRYYNKQCDYRIVFIHLHGNPDRKKTERIMYDLSQKFGKKEFYLDHDFVGLEVESKEEAVEIADRISSNFSDMKMVGDELTKKYLANGVGKRVKELTRKTEKSNQLVYRDMNTGNYFLLSK